MCSLDEKSEDEPSFFPQAFSEFGHVVFLLGEVPKREILLEKCRLYNEGQNGKIG